MTDVTAPALLDAIAAARRLGISPRTLRRMAADGRIASYKIGGSAKAAVRFAQDDVAAYLEACRRPAT